MSKTVNYFLAATTALSCGLTMPSQGQEFRVPWVLPASMGWVSPMVDPEGNTVLLGEYAGENLIPHIYGTTQFGDFTLPPLPARNFSACIAKADAYGSPLWLRALVTSSLNGGVYPHMSQLTTEGDVVFVGELHGSVTLGGATLQSGDQGGVPLIAKVAQDGDVLWARAMTTPTGSAAAQKIALDPEGSIYVAGQFLSELALDGQSITAVGGGGFLAKFSTEGRLIWLRNLPKSPDALAADTVGNVYLGGQAPDGTQFGSLTISARGDADAYVVKCDTDGNPLWVFGCGSEISDNCNALAVDFDGNCFMALEAPNGSVSGTFSVMVGDEIFSVSQGPSLFLVILSPNGLPRVTVPFEGMSSWLASRSLAVDHRGNAVALGQWRLGELEPLATLRIGNKSLSMDPATLNSGLFAANIGVNGACNWLLPLSRWHNTNGTESLSIWLTTSPAMGHDDSMIIAGNVRGAPKTLGTQLVTGPYLARINLPVLIPSLNIAATSAQLRLSWPLLADGFILQSAELLDGALDWQDLNLAPVLEGDEQVVAMDREQFEARFFRLRKP